jgi:hypothetical protein
VHALYIRPTLLELAMDILSHRLYLPLHLLAQS